MKTKKLLAALFLGLLPVAAVFAQDNADDSADVWSIVEAQWDAEEKGDERWIDRMLTDDFSGWPKMSPAPRNKSSLKMWDRFADQQGSMVAHELYPLSITIHGDVAIAHYLYTSAYESKDGEVELNNGRFTDVLIRTRRRLAFCCLARR